MRPVIIRFLNETFRTGLFSWLVPDVSVIYAGTVLICAVVFVRRCRARRLPEYHAWGAALCGSLAGIIGIRLWYLLTIIPQVVREPGILLQLNGPTVSFGGYLFGTVAFVAYLHANRQSMTGYLDALGSCLGLGPMIARWACFLNGDDYGTVTAVAWGVRYPPGSYAFADHVNRGYINLMADSSLPVHPVQIYLSVNGLFLFLVCTWLWKTRGLKAGVLFGTYWLLYGVSRFVLEFFRGDYDVPCFVGLTPGQVACALIAAGAFFYVARRGSSGLLAQSLRVSLVRWTSFGLGRRTR